MADDAPASDAVLASLASAADAARQAYLAALAANPGADLSVLYKKEMAALAAWSDAEAKALTNDPRIPAAQDALDAATANVRNELATLTDIASWLQLVDKLVQLATTVSGYFA
jgi:hypothetical protein